MLFVMIGITWIAVVMLLVVLCRMAARADATPAPVADVNPDSAPALATDWTLHDIARRRPPRPPLAPRRRSPSKQRTAGHGIR